MVFWSFNIIWEKFDISWEKLAPENILRVCAYEINNGGQSHKQDNTSVRPFLVDGNSTVTLWSQTGPFTENSVTSREWAAAATAILCRSMGSSTPLSPEMPGQPATHLPTFLEEAAGSSKQWNRNVQALSAGADAVHRQCCCISPRRK